MVQASEQSSSGELLLSVWLLSGLLPELGGELDDIPHGPSWQQREDVAQVGPGLDVVKLATSGSSGKSVGAQSCMRRAERPLRPVHREIVWPSRRQGRARLALLLKHLRPD